MKVQSYATLPIGKITGDWNVVGKQACRLRLSNQQTLDLMSASSTGCEGTPLQGVIGWRKFGRNGIETLRPGGATSAKLIDDGSGNFTNIETSDHEPLESPR